jgi:hypothetical protein
MDTRKAKGLGRNALLWCLLAGLAQAQAGQINASLEYAASQSIWPNGADVGGKKSGRSGDPGIGTYYDLFLDAGLVESTVKGSLQIVYPDVGAAGSGVNLGFGFLPERSGGSLESTLGIGIIAGVYITDEFCLARGPLGGCTLAVNLDMPVIDAGPLLRTTTSFDPALPNLQTASDAAKVVGRAVYDIGPFNVGPSVNLDVLQTITLFLPGLQTQLQGRNLSTGSRFFRELVVRNGMPTVQTGPLDPGIWEFEIVGLRLLNVFHNDIDLQLRGALDFVLGSWPPPGQGQGDPIDIVDDFFPLTYTLAPGSGPFEPFRITVLPGAASIPEPASIALLGVALAGFGFIRRTTRRRAIQNRSKYSRCSHSDTSRLKRAISASFNRQK